MRRITLWLLSTVAALVLLFSYRTSTGEAGGGPSAAVATATPSPSPTATATDGSSSSSSSSSSSTSDGSSEGSSSDAAGNGTYEGSEVQTRWGPIQVTITVADGKITDVAVPIYPDENRRDQEINAYALPALRQATLAAQSADVDSISGATVTSDGYRESLQAAIDAAHL